MSSRTDADITQILAELNSDGSDSAIERLLPLVYHELRAISQAYLGQERDNHTLQATALVHEAYLRLASGNGQHWQDRAHFFRVAAKTMRRILINHAHAHRAQKRGGARNGVVLQETSILAPDTPVDIEALDEAMKRLAELDRRKAEVVELRFFGGCTIEQTAETLEISTATVERHWRFARAWLRAELVE